ncbi:MAG: KpsF/GutQ family sugar-phosphate isomerase [Bacteroidales bacterium]|jgi:arabinose-5-phosphate isomerase|nr:KpsF/GutQ family sugar-phosphate isomerase [Bacteroidales bacterium]
MKSTEEIKQIAIDTIKHEADSINNLINYIGDNFVEAIHTILETKGKVVLTGIGKSGIVANKIVSSLNSTGTSAQFLHAGDAIHGDLGMISKQDCIICISSSGETPEIKILLPLLKTAANKIICITGNKNSYLAQESDIVLCSNVQKEACPNNLAPTASSTAQLVIGDAIVVALMECRGFTANDFAKVHPGGALGKKLFLKVSDLYKRNNKPVVNLNDDIKTIIYEISSKCLGVTAVLDDKKLIGVITDGDLRRMMSKYSNINKIKANDIMTDAPKTVKEEVLVVNALEIMRKNSITQLLVVNDDNSYIGVIHIHDILREGII